jgi:predicted HicB family RNase H-like nuclease
MEQKQFIVKSIKFEPELERKIRILAAEEGISFGEWVRRRIDYFLTLAEEAKKGE